ncbi:MAG TPA: amidohydrolase family protein [Thermoanaerobaculia bacterium]|jgi:imidazolonepropionase-like amidohydrolase|nr:amidohydrolase family protein [Thermoanaerobaculia bacterium]
MRKLPYLAGVLALAGMVLPGVSAPAAAQAPAPIVLKAARVFTSTSDRPLAPGMVIVEGDHIAKVGQNLETPPGAQVIDLGDATLMPGFIDAHVHMAQEMGDDWYHDFYVDVLRFPAEQALYAARYARRTLDAGFTTVRDLGSQDFVALGLRNAINAGVAEGPRMLIANHGIGSTGGHADQAPFPPDRVKPAGTIEGVCNGADQCREAVRYQIKYGADVIKCMPSGGVLSLSDPVDVPELTQEEMNAIVSEAHAWHRKVAAHCHGDAAARIAIAAGVDSIEHGSFLKDDTLRLMKEKGVYLVPTLFAGYWVGEKADKFPPAIAVKARAAAAQMQSMFQRAAKIGVKVAFGTDSAVEPHGLDAREFSLMVKNGFTPAQALLAATTGGADLLGLTDKIGTIETGKLADLVAVPGDPLQDIGQTEKVEFVMQSGRVVKNLAAAH